MFIFPSVVVAEIRLVVNSGIEVPTAKIYPVTRSDKLYFLDIS
jgi:hypothetical protein